MLNIQHLLSIRSNNQNPKASESNTQVQSGQYQPFLLGSPRCVHLPRSPLVLSDQHTQGGLWHHTFDRGTTELYMIFVRDFFNSFLRRSCSQSQCWTRRTRVWQWSTTTSPSWGSTPITSSTTCIGWETKSLPALSIKLQANNKLHILDSHDKVQNQDEWGARWHIDRKNLQWHLLYYCQHNIYHKASWYPYPNSHMRMCCNTLIRTRLLTTGDSGINTLLQTTQHFLNIRLWILLLSLIGNNLYFFYQFIIFQK